MRGLPTEICLCKYGQRLVSGIRQNHSTGIIDAQLAVGAIPRCFTIDHHVAQEFYSLAWQQIIKDDGRMIRIGDVDTTGCGERRRRRDVIIHLSVQGNRARYLFHRLARVVGEHRQGSRQQTG